MNKLSSIVRRASEMKDRQDTTSFTTVSNANDSPVTLENSKKGLSLLLASVFIMGEMAGSGVLALPLAISEAGWIGSVVLVACCGSALYSGICLGRCWVILEERWEENRQKIRQPYSAIGSRAIGPRMRYVVSTCVNITLCGVSTVFLLLCAQLIQSLLKSYFHLPSCYWILILATILCPLMWFGTPHDFWFAAVFALTTTASACFLLFVAIMKDYTNKTAEDHTKYTNPTFPKFFLAFGTILFSFGGAATFPTFQNDMRDKKQFPTAAIIGFAGLIVLYLPIAVSGFAVYGDKVDANILDTVTQGPLRKAIEGLLAGHLFFAFLIVINPPSQELEEMVGIPNKFSWKRCLLRVALLLIIVFIASTVPRFGKILQLIGGSTVTLLTFVFPPLFYMRLCSQEKPGWPQRSIPLHVKVFLIEIMLVGIIGGITSTYQAIREIIDPTAFTFPCYINITSGDL